MLTVYLAQGLYPLKDAVMVVPEMKLINGNYI